MNQKHLNAIGLMSGTSLDGIDVALLRSDGENDLERGPFLSIPYDDEFRNQLKQALVEAKVIKSRDERPDGLADLERELTGRHADAIEEFLAQHNLRMSDVDLIGFHGQTILHKPGEALTVQLGNGDLLSERTGIPVVYDMRANDMANGGQGAPLAPAYHRALVANMSSANNGVAIVNIGGISNISAVFPANLSDSELHAFDCGTGNILIDQWVEAHSGQKYDDGGKIGLRGKVISDVAVDYIGNVKELISDGRSLDRLDFPILDKASASLEDGARTLAHVTGQLIAASVARLPLEPKLWILCGGGRLNKAIIVELEEALSSDCNVVTAEEAGISGDAVEAEAWAYLAIRSMKGLPLTYPSTTGVNIPASGGVLANLI
ncbi:anhydro-N-acetylmuramic acid kinase [Lentilitoribacter sp. EG35]|uniref:anhydro-N-acetylmuramic acid kinase n=1 Tax=Lentilitoribacter sp. EG35 TaxID=3234192 RepID=UPI00345FA0BF